MSTITTITTRRTYLTEDDIIKLIIQNSPVSGDTVEVVFDDCMYCGIHGCNIIATTTEITEKK